jgi:arylsulfatase A-like enzyme
LTRQKSKTNPYSAGEKIMRKPIIIISLISAALLLAFLLMPMDSDKHKIIFDEKAIARKKEFLERASRETKPKFGRPNIVIILADDLGVRDLSVYGGKNLITPHMDSIAKDGVMFTQAYCSAPICSPSRAGMLTGRYQQRYGFERQPMTRYPKNRLEYYAFKYLIPTGNWLVTDIDSVPKQIDMDKQGLPPTEIILPEILKAEGYKTAVIGKWHLGHNEMFKPLNRGFDYHFGFYEAFTLYAPVDSPDIINHKHTYFADKHMWSMGRKDTCAIRINDKVIDEKEYLTDKIAKEAVKYIKSSAGKPFFLYVPFSAPHTPFQAIKKYYDMFSHVKDENKRVYYAMIKNLDDAVGEILKTIKDQGLDENTIILFASDNGGATYTEAADNSPLKAGKFSNFEGGLRIPMAVRWKGKINSGTVYNNPVSLMDFFGTSAEISGIKLPLDREYDGKNLMPYISGQNKNFPHKALFWKAAYNRAVLKDGWKLIIDTKNNKRILYNLNEDISEKNNLAAQVQEKVKQLEEEFNIWDKKNKPGMWPWVMDYRVTIDGEDYFFAL